MEKFSKFESTSPHENIPEEKQENIDIQNSLPQGENTILRELPQADKKTRRITIDGEDFVTINRLAKELGISHRVVSTAADDVSSFEARGVGGEKTTFYKESELREKLKDFLSLLQADEKIGRITKDGEDFITIGRLAKEFEINRNIVSAAADGVQSFEARGVGGVKSTFYKESELREKLKDFLSLLQADEKTGRITKDGEDFVTIGRLAKELGISHSVISAAADGVSSIEGKGATGGKTTFYKESEFREKLKDFLSLFQADEKTGRITKDGEDFVTINRLAKELSIANKTISATTDGVFSLKGRDTSGQKTTFYKESELREKLEKSGYFERKRNISEREQREKAEEDLTSLVVEMAEGETPRAEEIKKLISLFGGSSAVDILNKYIPSYRNIPIKAAERILGEYLGDFLPTRGSLAMIDEIDEKILLPNLQDFPGELSEVIKNHFLFYYKEKHQQDRERQDSDIIKDYFSELRDKWETKAPETFKALSEVIARAENYYNELNAIAIPEQLVGTLDSERKFPDINQRVNIKELMDKKKILIGDEMGMGKSASVIIAKESIFAKEVFGIKQALVVAPNNVISTWRTYLSQENEGGYFRDGMTPRVLVVENKESLENRDLSEYEYVLISQEKLKGHYVETLSRLPYDMLIVDEIHKLKNITSGTRSRNLLRLAERIQGENQYLALLSGTPVPNKIADIAITLKLIYPEIFEKTTSRALVRNIMQGNIKVRDLLVPRMQMKELADSIEMPRLVERDVKYELSQIERDIYETLLEEDELTASQKIHVLQKFLLNPELLDTTPGIQGSKIKAVSSALHETFENMDKVVMFVNRYAKGVTRENWSIVPKLNLPADIEIRTIDGPVKQKDRERIQKELRESKEKILLIVNGQTADVGVDFSPADSVFFYNDPWTKYEFKQQLGRAYRPGRNGDLECRTFRGKGTFEEGIFLHTEAKYRAIEKLLRDIPRSKLEQDILLEEEKQTGTSLEVHPELAKHYLSSWQRLLKMLTHTKEIGAKNFGRFATDYGEEYAKLYREQGRRSYQSNVNRVSATLLKNFENEKKSDTKPLILDVASGPEMLKRHIAEPYKERVVSIDAIRGHFKDVKDKSGLSAQANFTALPLKGETFDYVNFSLAFHETSRVSARREEYDRVQTLAEISRVLKKGGRAVINMIYSKDIADKKEFKKTASLLGFNILPKYSGTVTAGKNYCSHLVTLEKKRDVVKNLPKIIEKIVNKKHALKLEEVDVAIKDQRRILKKFALHGNEIPVFLNEEDRKVLEEEENILKEAENFKKIHGSIQNIPKEQVLQHNFSRYSNGKHYILFKKLESGEGWVVIK